MSSSFFGIHYFWPMAVFLIAFVVLSIWVRRGRSTFFDDDINQAAQEQWTAKRCEAETRKNDPDEQ